MGLKWIWRSCLPDLINAVLLCVVLSAANSNVYSGSRIIVGLANQGCAPAFFRKMTRAGVPYCSVAFTAAFGLLAFMNESSNGGTVFDWLLNITVVAGLIAWTAINICHIAFMRALKVRGISRDSLPWRAMLQPWYTWYGLFGNVVIILTQGFTAFIPWNTTDFYVSLILFVVLYAGHRLITRSSFVKPEDADLDSGRAEVDALVYEEVVPTTLWGRFWGWMS